MKTEKASLKETSTVETPAPKAAKTAAKTTAKTTGKRTPAKKSVAKEKVYLQYLGKEIDSEDIMKKVKEQWTKVLKNKVGDIKSITIYMKPEENAAYYVINGDVTGNVEL